MRRNADRGKPPIPDQSAGQARFVPSADSGRRTARRLVGVRAGWEIGVPAEAKMISLGFGKFARADRIYALEPLLGDERGDGRRTRVWIEGIPNPIVASRTESTILRDMGQEAAADAPLVDEAVDLASRLAAAAEAGRVDLSDLGRRARRLLAATTVRE